MSRFAITSHAIERWAQLVDPVLGYDAAAAELRAGLAGRPERCGVTTLPIVAAHPRSEWDTLIEREDVRENSCLRSKQVCLQSTHARHPDRSRR